MYRDFEPWNTDNPFGHGGITWQLDNILFALEDASKVDDARKYASLSSQLAVVLAPKLTPEEFEELSVPKVIDEPSSYRGNLREKRRDYERKLFIAARANVAEMLRIVSKRGIYAKEDKSPPPLHDGKSLALDD